MTDRKFLLNSAVGIATLALLLTTWLSVATSVVAQEDNELPLWISAVTCDDTACWQELGTVFTVTTMDGEFLGSCTQTSYRASCQVPVPSGITVVVTQDASTIYPGTAPIENPLYFDTSTSTDAEAYCCVAFENVPVDHADDNSLVDEIVDIIVRIITEILAGRS